MVCDAIFSVEFAPEALQEIQDAIEYYNKLSDGLGNRFKQKLLAAIKATKLNPTFNSIRYENVRFAVVKKFPYAAHYTIDQDHHVIKIQAILSFNQNPVTNWKIRF